MTISSSLGVPAAVGQHIASGLCNRAVLGTRIGSLTSSEVVLILTFYQHNLCELLKLTTFWIQVTDDCVIWNFVNAFSKKSRQTRERSSHGPRRGRAGPRATGLSGRHRATRQTKCDSAMVVITWPQLNYNLASGLKLRRPVSKMERVWWRLAP